MHSKLYSHRQPNRGFTLVEIMITVAILSIVAAVAVPSYIGQITKGRRADAIVTLADTAQRLGRCFTESNTYEYDADKAPTCPQSAELNAAPYGSDYYDFKITTANGGIEYTLEAKAKGKQADRDSKCQTLTLNQVNEKKSTPTGSYKCW